MKNTLYVEEPFLVPRAPEDFTHTHLNGSPPPALIPPDAWILTNCPKLPLYEHNSSLSHSDHDKELPSPSRSTAYTNSPFGALGLSEMVSPIQCSPLFRLDSDPEHDPPTPRESALRWIGLVAMDNPLHCPSPNSSVAYGPSPLHSRTFGDSPGSAWSCSTEASNNPRQRKQAPKRTKRTPLTNPKKVPRHRI